jgi:predicted pyridoxine 5'-phosphate oxidase superfamily flavin-nucleotide-binding protein
MLTDAIRTSIADSVLCWLATVDADGQPNVSPKEIFCVHGTDTLLIADIASPVSVRNILVNPKVCVSFVDVFRQHGWKLSGSACLIERTDPVFSVTGAELLAMAGSDFIIRDLRETDEGLPHPGSELSGVSRTYRTGPNPPCTPNLQSTSCLMLSRFPMGKWVPIT